MKRSLKVLKKKTLKSMQKLRINKNKQTECYKMKVWTDFGKVRVRTEIRYKTVDILLVYNGKRAHDLKVM